VLIAFFLVPYGEARVAIGDARAGVGSPKEILMTSLLTSQQFADEMNARLPAAASKITPRKVTTWASCGLIRSHSATKRAGFLPSDVASFIRAHPYKVLPWEYLRVSLIELRPDSIFTSGGKVYRTHAGYDGANHMGLAPAMARRAITSIWPVSDPVAQSLAARQVPLIGAVQGIVEPDMLYTIINYTRHAGRTIFHTKPASQEARRIIGGGALINVSRGPIAQVVG
jgi:hypothetical protein